MSKEYRPPVVLGGFTTGTGIVVSSLTAPLSAFPSFLSLVLAPRGIKDWQQDHGNRSRKSRCYRSKCSEAAMQL
jgi:hypothetical protein